MKGERGTFGSLGGMCLPWREDEVCLCPQGNSSWRLHSKNHSACVEGRRAQGRRHYHFHLPGAISELFSPSKHGQGLGWAYKERK